SPSAAIVTILVERIYVIVGLTLIFALNLLWFQPPPSLENYYGRIRAVGFGLLAVLFVGIGFLIWFRKNSAPLLAALDGLFSRWHFCRGRLAQVIIRLLEQLSGALRVLVNAGELAETAGWTAVLWLGVASANLLVLRAFHVDLGFSETIFVLGWSMVGSVV